MTGTALVVAPQRRDLAVIAADLKRVTDEHKAALRDRKGQNLLALARAYIVSQAIAKVLHASTTAASHVLQTTALAMQHQHLMNMAALKVATMALHAAASRPPAVSHVAPTVPFAVQAAIRNESARILAAGEYRQLFAKHEKRVSEAEFSRRVDEQARLNLAGRRN